MNTYNFQVFGPGPRNWYYVHGQSHALTSSFLVKRVRVFDDIPEDGRFLKESDAKSVLESYLNCNNPTGVLK